MWPSGPTPRTMTSKAPPSTPRIVAEYAGGALLGRAARVGSGDAVDVVAGRGRGEDRPASSFWVSLRSGSPAGSQRSSPQHTCTCDQSTAARAGEAAERPDDLGAHRAARHRDVGDTAGGLGVDDRDDEPGGGRVGEGLPGGVDDDGAAHEDPFCRSFLTLASFVVAAALTVAGSSAFGGIGAVDHRAAAAGAGGAADPLRLALGLGDRGRPPGPDGLARGLPRQGDLAAGPW